MMLAAGVISRRSSFAKELGVVEGEGMFGEIFGGVNGELGVGLKT